MLPSPRPAAPSHHSRPAGGMVISGYGSLSRRLLQSKLPYRFVHRTRNSSTSVSSISISLLDRRRHDDAPRLRHDVVSEKTRRGETRDAWHDVARGEGPGARREGAAHGATARAGARRARQDGRGGRGPRPCAAREGTAVSCQVDGTRPGESPAGRRPGSAAGMPREPRRSAAPCASAACRTPRCARPAGGRARHGGRDAREARGLPSALQGGLDEEARPLPRLVPVGRADEEVGRRQGGHPVGPGGDGGLRQHAVRPREGAAAPLVLLGG